MTAKPYGDRLLDAQQAVFSTFGALGVGVLYLALPGFLSLGPSWLLLVVEAGLALPLLVSTVILPRIVPLRVVRTLALTLLAVVTVALIGSVYLLIANLARMTNGTMLLRPAALLWGINVLVFATWYWETDGSGPVERRLRRHEAADFLFPQQVGGNKTRWAPGFVDYVFLAFCFATALSPADTAPLTRRAKLLMIAEAVLSLLIVVLLIGRSVNILA